MLVTFRKNIFIAIFVVFSLDFIWEMMKNNERNMKHAVLANPKVTWMYKQIVDNKSLYYKITMKRFVCANIFLENVYKDYFNFCLYVLLSKLNKKTSLPPSKTGQEEHTRNFNWKISFKDHFDFFLHVTLSCRNKEYLTYNKVS